MVTYRELESSEFRSRPITLFHFLRGSEEWWYTSSKFTVVFDGDVYEPLEITHGEIDTGGADKPGAVQITLPTDSDLGLTIQAGLVPGTMLVRLIRLQKDVPAQPAVIFRGELESKETQDEIMVLQSLPFAARLDVTVPQGLWQRDQCQWNTYDPLTCKVDKATYTFTGTISAISGTYVTVTGASAFDPGTGTRADMFAGGILAKGDYQAMIDFQSGDQIALVTLIPGLTVGDSVNLTAGDNRLAATCRVKFNNAGRRLSFLHMPVIDPYVGQGLRS